MYFRPSASDCDSSDRLNFMNIRPIATWAMFRMRELRGENHAGGEPHLGKLLLAHLADGMARRHVPDLVPQDRRKLGLRVQVGHDAAGHVDEAAGDRKSVHRRVIDHAEVHGRFGRSVVAASRAPRSWT